MDDMTSRELPPNQRPLPHTPCTECWVRQLALFGGVPPERLSDTQRYRRGQFLLAPRQHLYRSGERHPYLYSLHDGWAILYHAVEGRKRQIIRFLLPGDFFGLQAACDGPMSHSVQAVTEAVVCAFPRDHLDAMLRDAPEIASRLAAISARDMQECQHHLVGTGRKRAIERLAYLLLELYHRCRLRGRVEANSVQLPLAQEDLADAVGLTTVHVNRTLRELRERGLIRYHDRRLVILDEPALTEIAQFDETASSLATMP